jgi:dihydroxyacid dehydratase/phosphogluconate dehydratase
MPAKRTEKATRSRVFTGGDPSSIGRRSLRYSVGHTCEQIERPLVAIVNTWNEVHPGHAYSSAWRRRRRKGC